MLKNQWLRKPDLDRLRNRMVRGLVLHAYRNVPFYKNLWDNNGVDITRIKTAEDLEELPAVTKRDVLENYTLFIASNYRKAHDFGSYVLRPTSGTSGNPLEVIFDERANDYLEAVYLRGLMVAGYKPWKPLVYYWWKEFDKRIYNSFGFMNKVYIPCSLSEDEQLRILQSRNTGYIYYYGGILYSIAQKMLHLGINMDVETVITHAEMITNRMRRRITKAFGVEPFDQYGTTEFNRLAWQCEKRDGYHMDADSVVVGMTDENSAVITGLVNYMMPLIRYDMGDIIEVSDDGCSCGRTLPVIKGVKGRREDLMVLNSGKILTPAIVADAISGLDNIFKFSAVYKNKNKFHVDAVLFKEDRGVEDLIEKALCDIAKEKLTVDVKVVDEISKSKRGKRKLVSTEKAGK